MSSWNDPWPAAPRGAAGARAGFFVIQHSAYAKKDVYNPGLRLGRHDMLLESNDSATTESVK